jgi:hypothetical protein
MAVTSLSANKKGFGIGKAVIGAAIVGLIVWLPKIFMRKVFGLHA